MKFSNSFYLFLICIFLIGELTGCQKNTANSGSLYTPTSADVTALASLKDLQDGRALYVNNCGECHGFYLPENYSPSQWTSILNSMAPRTGMSDAQKKLVKKYVTKGK